MEAGEIVNQVIDQAHVAVSIIAGKLYPLSNEDPVIGEAGSYEQGDSKKQSHQRAADEPGDYLGQIHLSRSGSGLAGDKNYNSSIT